MKTTHKQKLQIAKRLCTKITPDGKKHVQCTGFFLTAKWDYRKLAIAKRVQNKIIKIKEAIKLKKLSKLNRAIGETY